MESKELRHGNLVWVKDKRNVYFKETYAVLDIFGKSGLCNLQDIKSGFFKPRYSCMFIEGIPLTPEILLKVGFTNEIEEELPEDAEFLCFFKDNIDVELRPGLLGYEIEGITLYEDAVDNDGQLVSESKYEIKADVKYLHQLQNLYYCLVGHELTINL